jgi:hypothetical protein
MCSHLQAPQPAEPWEGIRDALKEGDVAPQTGVFQFRCYAGNEDCLFINVFTPKVTGHINCENDFPYDTKTINMQYHSLSSAEKTCMYMRETLGV